MPPPPATERRFRQPQADKVDARVARLAARQWGVVSLDDLRACGMDRQMVSVRVARGWLHPLHRAVYAVGHTSLAVEGRFLAAVKACGPGAVLSHRSAAVLWDLLPARPGRVDVTAAGEGTHVHRGIGAHRTSVLEAVDRRRRRGIPVTSPARTILDCAGVLDERSLRRAVREGQARSLVAVPELLGIVDRLGPRRGTRRLGRIIASGPAPTRSVLEDVVLDLIIRGGLAHPDVNVPLTIAGRRVVPDFRWPQARLVVEADGAAWHDHRLAREDDAERQALLEAYGDRVLRVTWAQAVGRPGQTLTRLRSAGAPPA